VPDASRAVLTGLRVLVVEDEFLIALDLLAILDDLGCVALGPAPTVAEALHLLAADPPDAALLDMNLRGVRATPSPWPWPRAGFPSPP
jgi:CheY-like chemotaxis protein